MLRSSLTGADRTTRLVDAGMACVRVVVPVGFVALALVGALVTPAVGMLLVAPLTGAAGGLVVARLDPGFPGTPEARRRAVLTAATGAASVPFVNGVELLGVVGGVLALVLLVLASCLAADWLMDLIEASPSAGAPPDEGWMRAVLEALPTAALLQEWRATERACGAGTGPAERARVAQLRGLLLEELARRDPVAVERWLTSGDWAVGPRMRSDRDVAG